MLTPKIHAKDYELTLLTHKSKSGPFPKQSQGQNLLQAEHFRPKFCFKFLLKTSFFVCLYLGQILR